MRTTLSLYHSSECVARKGTELPAGDGLPVLPLLLVLLFPAAAERGPAAAENEMSEASVSPRSTSLSRPVVSESLLPPGGWLVW